jgi:hypothetical protein
MPLRILRGPRVECMVARPPPRRGKGTMKKHILRAQTALLVCAFASPAFAGDGVANIFGDFVYKTSAFNHTGVLYNPDAAQVADVTTGRGDRSLSVTRKRSDFDWGARRYSGGLTSAQQTSLKARIDYFNSYKVRYDGNHLNQKGKWFSGSGGYWEFDCVGFTERIYEDIGLNPTANSYESGWGWPLTPGEQRGGANVVVANTLLRTTRDCSSGQALGGLQRIDITSGYSNYTCASRYQEQCINDGSFDTYYDERCE